MKNYLLFFLFVIWKIESITGNQSTDPRSNPTVDNITSKAPDKLIYSNFANSTPSLDPILNIPDDLLFGAGTSALQSEGAWNTNGKTESFMEYFMRTLKLANPSEFHVGSDSYHQYKQDVKVLKDIGLSVYRFSLSWPRLLPTGYTDNINEDGVRFYHDLLDELIKNGIKPYVLLSHFDHPIALEKKFGGWNNEGMIEAFVEYATFVFKEFGSKIRIFVTFNEPRLFCYRFVSHDRLNSNDPQNSPANLTIAYRCVHNLLKAHSTVYHIYHKHFNPTRDGMIGINLSCEYYFPKHKDDHLSPEIAFQFGCGWMAHPIFSKSGDYPKLMRELIDEKSKMEGLKESRLPTFSEEWIDYIKGTADFFALTHYESHLVEPIPKDNSSWSNILLPINDTGLAISVDPNWPQASNGFYIVPHGFRPLLRKIKEEYDNPLIYVTENGYANNGELDDVDRIQFLYAFLRELLYARKYDQCNIKMYVYWSLIDSFEFHMGYSTRFGLAHVDHNSPNQTRTLRRSASWLRNVIEKRKLYNIYHVLHAGSSASRYQDNTRLTKNIVSVLISLEIICLVLVL